MTRQPRRHSILPEPAPHLLYDEAWPVLVDSVARVEAAAYRAGEATRRAPIAALLIAAGAGVLMHRVTAARRRDRGPAPP